MRADDEAATEPLVLSRKSGSVGLITLNRPRAINALNLSMVRDITNRLAELEADSDVEVIILTGAGDRGFCAGGDMVSVCRDVQRGSPAAAARFFEEEYALNLQIARCAKSIVAIMDGIVLGGGVGLAGHASHRLVTETARVGMPEVGIGFLPDVGGTWLLSRASGELGTFVALTGMHLDADGAIACNLADRRIERSSIETMVARLCDGAQINDRVGGIDSVHQDSDWSAQRPWINRCFGHDDAATILSALDEEADTRAREAAATIRTRSPLAVTVTLRALRIARQLADLESCLTLEHSAVMEFLDTPDLHEGVRAALIDKDRSPRWQPATLEDVDPRAVDRYFARFRPASLEP